MKERFAFTLTSSDTPEELAARSLNAVLYHFSSNGLPITVVWSHHKPGLMLVLNHDGTACHEIRRKGASLELSAHGPEEVDREMALMALGGQASCDCFEVCWTWRFCLLTGRQQFGAQPPRPFLRWLDDLHREDREAL